MSDADTAIAHCLEQEHALAAQLLDALLQEEAALLGNDAEALLRVAQGKSELIARFMGMRQTRLRQFEKAGLPALDSSMARWVERQADAGVQAQWQQLIELAQKSQELNRTNGVLIQRLSVRNQAALAALQGSGNTDLYGPSGRSASRSRYQAILG